MMSVYICEQIWDRRERAERPVSVLVGHTEGLTHLDPKGDGLYLISNSKDQTIKLWDLRRACSEREVKVPEGSERCSYQWYALVAVPALDLAASGCQPLHEHVRCIAGSMCISHCNP